MGMPRIIVTTHDGAVVGDLDPTLVTALTMTRQVNGEHSLSVTTTQALAKNDRLLLRDGTLKWHEFVVDGITAARPDSGGEVEVTYYCPWSVQHDLSETFVNGPYDCGIVPGHASIMHPAIDGVTVALGSTSRWAIGTVDVATQAAASFYRQTGWEGMQTVVEKWGGEVEADITVGLDGVTGRSVSLLAHVGSEEATRRFDYSADMKSIKRTVQDTPWTCRIVPLGKSRETEAGGYTRRPSIESVNDGVMWIEDADAVPLTRVPDGSGGWEYPTQIVYNDVYEEPAELLAWAREHITDYTRPKVTYEADVVQLARAGLSPLGVGLGDEVAIVDRAFCEGGLRIQGRVLKMVEDLLDPSNTKLTIGNLGTTLASQLSGIAREVYEITSKVDNMTQVQGTAEYVSDLIARMNAEANATGGFTYITEGQGIRTYDRAVSDPLVGAEATQVVEIKGGNVRIANSRTSTGDWDWRTVIVSGHVASDLVTTAQLVAGTIRPATGSDWWDLDNNILHIGAVDTLGTDVAALETLVHPYGQGVLVCKTGQTIGALVNADGSFDVVKVTWSGGTPTAGSLYMRANSGGTTVYNGSGTALASFGTTATIGITNGAHVSIESTGLSVYRAWSPTGTTTVAQLVAQLADGYLWLVDPSVTDPVTPRQTRLKPVKKNIATYTGSGTTDVVSTRDISALNLSTSKTADGSASIGPDYGYHPNLTLGRLYVVSGMYVKSSLYNTGGIISDGSVRTNTSAHVIKDTRFDRDGSNPSENVWSAVFGFQDTDGENLGYLQAVQTPDGRTGLNLYAIAEDSSGNTFGNFIRLFVDKSGTKSYAVSDAAKFRSAINAQVAGSYQAAGDYAYSSTEQHPYFWNAGASDQLWGLSATCKRSTNTSYYNKKVGLVVGNTYLGCYNNTDSESLWTAYTTKNKPTPADIGAHVAGVSLYNNTSGSNGTVTLSAAVTGYQYLDVWVVTNNKTCPQCVRIPVRAANTTSDLYHVEASANTTVVVRHTRYAISGKTMTPSNGNSHQIYNATVTHSTAGNNLIYITRVIGYTAI